VPAPALTVDGVDLFTNPNTATFTVGTPGAFGISANTGTISSSSVLPNGLLFLSESTPGCPQCLATISGSAVAGMGGQYGITLNDDGGSVGTATQSLTLNVNEGPKITSAVATMFAGLPGSFAVTTTGSPSVSDHVIPANPQPPTDPSQGDGMFFTVIGLPTDLQASNLTPGGFATGTLTIQGTPSAADVGRTRCRSSPERSRSKLTDTESARDTLQPDNGGKSAQYLDSFA
jgi:hypothetical protein